MKLNNIIKMNSTVFKYLLVFLTSVRAYNKNNRLVDVWDNIKILDNSTQTEINSFNMTSFPYIEGVSKQISNFFFSTKPTRPGMDTCATQKAFQFSIYTATKVSRHRLG
jgi:hypothetical protein